MEFYTIVNSDGVFMNSNLFCSDTKNIINAIKFRDKEDAEVYLGQLIKDDFKVAKVTCTYKIDYEV